jgi:hypothetical protein
MLGVAMGDPGCSSGVYVSLELGTGKWWAGELYLKYKTRFTSPMHVRPYWQIGHEQRTR